MHSKRPGVQWLSPDREGVPLVMSIKDALSLMIQFASLVVAIIVAVVTVTRKK
jgi:hypothetical protein